LLFNIFFLNSLRVIKIKDKKIKIGNVDLKNNKFSYKVFFTKLLLNKSSGLDDNEIIVAIEKVVNM
jgi:hypothetical protein